MSKLNIDQKSIRTLFSEKKADFLIPDYQRPYAWEEKECQTLWDDLFLFAFPDNDCDKFNSESDEYFLGSIVTFKNEEGKMEIIDGQQRLTTLMLLLRAFYEKYGSMKNDKAVKTSNYVGFENARKQRKEGTKIKELTDLAASVTDFAEADIVQRNAQIIFSFVEYMHSNGLLSMD